MLALSGIAPPAGLLSAALLPVGVPRVVVVVVTVTHLGAGFGGRPVVLARFVVVGVVRVMVVDEAGQQVTVALEAVGRRDALERLVEAQSAHHEQIEDDRAHLGTDDLRGERRAGGDVRRHLPELVERAAVPVGQAARAEVLGHPGRDLGELVDHVEVALGHDLPLPQRDRRPADEDPQVAHRPIERHEEVGDLLDGRQVVPPERGGADDREPVVGEGLEREEGLLTCAGPVESALGAVEVSLTQGDGRLGEQVGGLLDDLGRVLARAPQRGRGSDRRGDEGDATTHDRVDPPGERLVGGGDEDRHHRRLHARLRRRQDAAVDDGHDRHRREHDHRELPVAAADDRDRDVADEDADGDADDDLHGAFEALPEGETQRDHRGDGREEGLRVAEHVAGDEPGHGGRECDLGDEEEPFPQASVPLGQRVPPVTTRRGGATRERGLEVVGHGHPTTIGRPGPPGRAR